MLLLFAACASLDAPPAVAEAKAERPAACADTVQVTWESWGHGFFLTYCNACHSGTASNRNGAPEGVDFDTRAQASALKARVYARVLEEGTMPAGGGVADADLQLLRVLLACDL